MVWMIFPVFVVFLHPIFKQIFQLTVHCLLHPDPQLKKKMKSDKDKKIQSL